MMPATHILAKLLLVTSLAMPGLQPLVDTDKIETLETRHEALLERRAGLVGELEQLEGRLERLVEQIDEAKASPGTLPGQRDVQSLMRRAQRLSRELESHQQELRGLDDKIKGVRSALLERLEGARQALEEQLRQAPPGEREALVDQLNALRDVQQRFDRPLPEAPDAAEVQQALEFAARADAQRPDQLRAAADELEDTRDQLTRRIEALKQRIDQVQQRQQLNRQAKSFRAREDLFDEASRPQIAGVSEGSSSDNASAGDGESASPTNGEVSDGSGNQTSGDDPSAGLGDSEERFGNAGPESPGGDSDRSADDQFAAPPTAGGGDSSGGAGGGESPFNSASSGAFRADPGQVAPEEDRDGISGSKGRLEMLKQEKQRLRQRARELEDKAGELRKQADEAESAVE
jgi:uncharacterized coiled-coil DUF342 family protein